MCFDGKTRTTRCDFSYPNYKMSKPGSGGVASADNANIDRRERLRKLALETIDLAKDPYFMKNHLGNTLFSVIFTNV